MNQLQPYLNHYNITVKYSQSQASYETEIHKIINEKGESYTLKIYNFSESNLRDLKAENQIINHLKGKLSYDLPYPIANTNKEFLTKVDDKIIRLLHFVEGTFWGSQDMNDDFLISLGTQMANLDLHLAQQDPTQIKTRKLNWDLCNLHNNFVLINFISDPEDKQIIHYFFDQFKVFSQAKLEQLPKALIHNDFNPWNVLVHNQKVTGLIDFGDMVFSARINELAVSLSYVLSDSNDILKDAKLVITAYHTISPLLIEELDLLYHLIAGRIITSLVNSAQGKSENPDNEYIQISEKPYRKLLRQWISINPIGFTNAAYEACNYPVHDNENKKTAEINISPPLYH